MLSYPPSQVHIPPYRLTLASYPSMSTCLDAIERLSAQFKAVHKRKPNVELLCSVTFGKAPNEATGYKGTPDLHSIVLTSADPVEARAEIAWFVSATSTAELPIT